MAVWQTPDFSENNASIYKLWLGLSQHFHSLHSSRGMVVPGSQIICHRKIVNFLEEKKSLGYYNISAFIFHHISIKGFRLQCFWG